MAVISKDKKKQIVEELASEFKESRLNIVSDLRGLTVPEIDELRKKVRQTSGVVKVVKNTMARLALNKNKLEYSNDMFSGPTALIYTKSEPVNLSKVIIEYSEDHDNFDIKGGILNNEIIDEKIINALAKLPSRDELIAKTVGSIKSPLNNLVYVLGNPIKKLVYVLNSIQQNKSGGEG